MPLKSLTATALKAAAYSGQRNPVDSVKLYYTVADKFSTDNSFESIVAAFDKEVRLHSFYKVLGCIFLEYHNCIDKTEGGKQCGAFVLAVYWASFSFEPSDRCIGVKSDNKLVA